MDRRVRRDRREGRPRARDVPAAQAPRPRARAARAAAAGAQHAVLQHDPARGAAAVSRAISTSSSASSRSCAGTRSRWWCARTATIPSSAATSRPTRRSPISSKSASTISSARGRTAISSTSSRTRRPASTRARSSKAASPKSSSRTIAARPAARACSSYCHPYLMPDFWQFPNASMGIGPITAIYQARFLRYLENRGILETAGRKVWAFVGDGEMDEPESLAGLSVAAREGLDNLIFVVNCNLQRLDGPVRGNGSIIQELEGLFAGAGWNVIKVLWGSRLGPALRARRRERHHPAAARDGRRRVPEIRRDRRALQPRELLQQVSRAPADRRAPVRRGHRPAAPRRPRPGQDLRGVSRRGELQGPARRSSSRRPRRATAWATGARAAWARTRRRSSRTTRCSRSATASRCRSPTRTCTSCASTSPRDDSPEMRYLHAPPREARRLPARAQSHGARRCRCRRSRASRASSKARSEREESTTMVFVQHALAAPAGPEHRQAHRADRRRRGAHLRHAVALPAGRDLFVGRPALRSRGQGRAALLQGSARRADPRGRHHRSRRDVVVDRGGDVVQRARRADAAVLHLLFDVRLPARRRFHLGRGRFARARLPARRDRGPHDAFGRRPAAPGRLEPSRRGDGPELPRLRPVLTATSSRRSSATACGACSKRRKTSSTTSR